MGRHAVGAMAMEVNRSRGAVVRPEDAAELLPGLDARRRLHRGLTIDQPVARPLVVPLQVRMGRVLLDCQPEVPLADGDDLGEALLLDRPDEPLGVGAEVGAPRGWPAPPPKT